MSTWVKAQVVIASSTSASLLRSSSSFFRSFSNSVHGRTFSLTSVVGLQRRFVVT